MRKLIDTTKAMLEDMASNNYYWSNKRTTSRRGGDKYDVDTITLLASRVDALAQRLDQLGTIPIPGRSSSPVGVCAVCETYGVQ